MNTFRKLFAVSPQEIKHDVIITPILNLDYFKSDKKNKINKGFLFEVLNEKYFSVIKTGVGPAFVGDAVMYLRQTKAKRLYFIGSCGAVSKFQIGDLAVVDKVLSLESFSNILHQDINYSFINAQNSLCDEFLERHKQIKKANLATIGSLSLQENILPLLKQYGVDIVDMEVSAFINAAKFLKFQSMALLYVTDIIKDKPFCRDLAKKERIVIQDSRRRAISLLCEIAQKKSA